MKYIKTYESVSKNDLQEELHDLVTNHRYTHVKKHSLTAYKIRKELKELIDLGVDINEPYDNTFKSGTELPLWTAIHNRNYYIAELLIKYGADVYKIISTKTHGIAPIGHIAASEDNLDILRRVIEAGLDWNIKHYGETFLQWLKTWEKEQIIKEYPEKYKEFLEKEELKNDTEKYNL